MAKRVLDVGNCVPDHAAIRTMLEQTFGAEVLQTDGPDDTLALLRREPVNLVLVNRKLDHDYSDGLAAGRRRRRRRVRLRQERALQRGNTDPHREVPLS